MKVNEADKESPSRGVKRIGKRITTYGVNGVLGTKVFVSTVL